MGKRKRRETVAVTIRGNHTWDRAVGSTLPRTHPGWELQRSSLAICKCGPILAEGAAVAETGVGVGVGRRAITMAISHDNSKCANNNVSSRKLKAPVERGWVGIILTMRMWWLVEMGVRVRCWRQRVKEERTIRRNYRCINYSSSSNNNLVCWGIAGSEMPRARRGM